MTLINTTAHGCNALDTYPKPQPYSTETHSKVHDGSGEQFEGMCGPEIPRRIEKRNLDLRNSVIALAHIFCEKELDSENWPKVFQALHEVYRGVSVKEWESIFDGRTPLSLERRNILRRDITGEACNRSFTIIPPPQDHPVVLRLNQVKWDLFVNPDTVDKTESKGQAGENVVEVKSNAEQSEIDQESNPGNTESVRDDSEKIPSLETLTVPNLVSGSDAAVSNEGVSGDGVHLVDTSLPARPGPSLNKSKKSKTPGEKKGNTPKKKVPNDELSDRRNVMSDIIKYGHDEDFTPSFVDKPGTPEKELWLPTDAPAGSLEKIEVLRKRVELGQHLWHPDDRVDYSGLGQLARLRAG